MVTWAQARIWQSAPVAGAGEALSQVARGLLDVGDEFGIIRATS